MYLTKRPLPFISNILSGRVFAVAAFACLSGGCAQVFDTHLHSEIRFPMSRAWFDGHMVDYVTTDVSDAAVAAALGVNYVPRLGDALPTAGHAGGSAKSLLERVYKFDNSSQPSVFQSAPSPTGPANKDGAYSPLWRMVTVHWKIPGASRELRSEEEILRAQDRDEVELTLNDVVLNCPVIRSVDGKALGGVR